MNSGNDQLDMLVVDDDPVFRDVLARALTRRGFNVAVAGNSEEAIQIAAERKPQRAVVDLKLADESGLRLIPTLLEAQPELEVVMLTGYASIATAVEAVKAGAINYLCKPAGTAEILAAFGAAGSNVDIEPPANPISVDRLEWEHIQRVLQENDGNISATARALGMHRRTLQRKLQKRPVRR